MNAKMCPLCGLKEREPENILAAHQHYLLVRTKFLKGHKERIMLMDEHHTKNAQLESLLRLFDADIKKLFSYTYKAIVMDGKYGSVPNHWHVCITDLEQNSEDYHQVLGTPWLKVIDIKSWWGNESNCSGK